jgi:hypothetical protein
MKQMEHSYKGGEKFLVNDLKTIVSKARSKAFAAVNYSLVERNWRIGKRIVEEEQNGEARAEYGKHIIEVASAALTEEFGKGFSETNLINFKKFFLLFKELEIHQTVSEEFRKQVLHLLPWSHYERLIRIEDKQVREHQTNIEKFISFLSPVYTFWAFCLFYSEKSRIFAITIKL